MIITIALLSALLLTVSCVLSYKIGMTKGATHATKELTAIMKTMKFETNKPQDNLYDLALDKLDQGEDPGGSQGWN